jgi:hypothetical protein
MSIFEQRTLTCPHCGARAEHAVAVSVNGGRSPQYRQQILDGSFQVMTCATCGEKADADGPFIYIDLRAKQWIGCFPRAWEAAWRSYENEPLDSWRRSMVDHAPSNVRRMADGFRVRAVFGLPALREKLLCFVHDIDDRVLEALKLDLLRSHPALVMNPDARPLLVEAGDATLVLIAHVPPSPAAADSAGLGAAPASRAAWRDVRITMPRAELDRIRADASAWASVLVEVAGGPYVDLGRIMLTGTARLTA